MSLKLMRQVLDSDVSPVSSRMVLLVLADFANEAGEAWPSIATLAKRAGVGWRTVDRSLADLEAAGHLTRERRFNRSNGYLVTPQSRQSDRSNHANLTGLEEADRANLTGGSRQSDRSNHATVGALTTNEPPIEPKDLSASIKPGTKKFDVEPLFEQWWKAYPKRAGKLDAKRAFVKALRLTTAETLTAAAKAYAAIHVETERRFIANPATWLNQGRWDDDDIQAATPVAVEAFVNDCWNRADTAAITKRSGLDFQSPDLPDHITTAAQARAYTEQARRDWIKTNAQAITAAITKRETAA